MAMRDWFIKDFGWKIFSVVLAVVIWLTVNKILGEGAGNSAALTSGTTLTYGNLPVLIVSSAADVRDFRIAPTTVTVEISGSADDMAKLQASEIRAVVDLTGIESAKDLHCRVDVSTPPGITLIRVDPPRVGVIVPPRP
jgi:YbbR domain-containing protein